MARGERTDDRIRITKRTVDAAKPRVREYVLWDADITGFGIKMLPSGRKVYLLKYRTKGGAARKPNIGVHGDITAEQARKTASDWHGEVAGGGDPSARMKAERELRRWGGLPGDKPFRDVLETFIDRYAKPRQRTWQETQRTLESNCAKWLDRKISEITKADTIELLDGFVAAGHEAKARVTLTWLRTLFRWAVTRDIIGVSPVDAIDLHLERKIRTRFYSDDEIKQIWNAADGLAIHDRGGQARSDLHVGAFVKLCLLLGVRRNELAGMRRSEFDNPDNPTVWTVPHDRTKTRKTRTEERVYIVPLPRLAQRVIKGLPKHESGLVFPGRHKGKPMYAGTSLKDRVREGSGVADWSYHPCRDTVASWLKEQGHSKFERALVLNHSEVGVTSDYSHSYPVDLKRDLLEKWAGHVAGIVQPERAVLLS